MYQIAVMLAQPEFLSQLDQAQINELRTALDERYDPEPEGMGYLSACHRFDECVTENMKAGYYRSLANEAEGWDRLETDGKYAAIRLEGGSIFIVEDIDCKDH